VLPKKQDHRLVVSSWYSLNIAEGEKNIHVKKVTSFFVEVVLFEKERSSWRHDKMF
jgi:hypothetical protein